MTKATRKVSTPRRNKLTILGIVIPLTACGTFQLASSVVPPAGKSQEQQQLDNLTCKDQAKLEANTAERQAGAFALGLTIVGAPVAFELEKAKQREVYKGCMEARGYRVTPPVDAQNSQATSGTAARPPSQVTKLTIDLPPGWERKALSDQMTANGGIAFATNRTTDSGVIVSNVRRDTITDLSTFVQSRRAAQENRLTDAMKTDIAELSIAGRRAFRTAVTGSFRNTRLTYLLTVIEGTEEIAIVNAWTTTSNYDQQRVALEALSGNVAGL